MGGFRGSKKQMSGKCHELPRKSNFFFKTWWVGGSFRGKNFNKSSGNFMNCREKSIHFFNPPPQWGVIVQKLEASSFKKVSRECSYPERWRSRVIRGWRKGGADGREKRRERQAGKEGPE